MASNFHVQKPYVLATLPRPLDPTTGRYVVGEVYGTAEGSRKRKRSEVTVGIDGEAVNIYHVSSARLVTSYPIPPQSSFTCPPCSLRRRIPSSKDVARYTYIATADPVLKVTLFKDIVESSGKTTSSTRTFSLPSSKRVVYLTARLADPPKADAVLPITADELLIVQEDGEIIGLDSEELKQKWRTTPAILHQDLAYDSASDFRIETCTSARASEVIDGLFKGDKDALSSIANYAQNGVDPEVLLVVSSIDSDSRQARHLHLLAPIPQSQSLAQTNRGLVQLHVVPIAASSAEHTSTEPRYRLDVRSGSLTELADGSLTVHDLTASIPKISSQMHLENATSIIRLSKTSILTATDNLLSVYNPQFRSMQSSVIMEPDSLAESGNPKAPGCSLVAYFSKLELAIGISGFQLLAIQLEAPKSRTKRRAEGLLIDSIGCGIPDLKRVATEHTKRAAGSSAFSNYLPGSVLGDYLGKWTKDVQRADELLDSEAVYEFEVLLAEQFGLQIKASKTTNVSKQTNGDHAQPPPEWNWPKDMTKFARADRRWIVYAISRAFQWNDEHAGDDSIPHLTYTLPDTNIVTYLAAAGHLTISNVKSALRDELSGVDNVDHVLANELVTRISELDPSFELLTCYVRSTAMGPVELLLSVRAMMRSLDAIRDRTEQPPKLLTNGAPEGSAENEDISKELDHLEEEVLKAESILRGNAGIREEGLSVAFAKLGNCPASSMIKALQTALKPKEILDLVLQLRIELYKGAWTSRYVEDNTDYDEDADLHPPPDGSIKLISDLLSRCVDAIGPSGWLLNDSTLSSGEAGDVIASLTLEVSTALEGLEEAVYLKGIVGEAVRYCEAAQKETNTKQKFDLAKPISLQVKEPGAEALPLGLKVKGRIEKSKIVSGGEIVQRSIREQGHLRSQQVGVYSLERIAI
ncbi:putative Nucleoporin Nup133/Nup155-like N-terminal domain-containing protein [Seiridium cardinale]|uniref:Nucleoporin Nup133/Nup155-like N-terminal domain-containing protein n=1 Tax=Seiridium cardinale TaxID=138064 RepID=A0ABR2Y397_9PEZI